MNPYRIDKFDGGINDAYLAVTPGRNAWLENFYLDETGKPEVRWGTVALPNRIPTSGASTRLSGLYVDSVPFNYPLVVRADNIYRIDSSDVPNAILGPTGNLALPNKTHTDFEAATIWQRQMIVASSPDTCLPTRVLNTSGDATFLAYTLGLPAITTKPTVASAGGTANTYAWGFHWLWVFNDGANTTFEEIGPPVFVQLTNIGTPNTNTVSISNLPVITNTASTNYDTTTTVIASIGTTNASPILTGFSSTTNIVEGTAITGTNIPAGSRVLSKTATTVTIDRNATGTGTVTVTLGRLVVKIYRTASNGTTFFELATIRNGTTTYSDTRSDADITSNEVIYTDGDVQPWEAPPADAKYVVEVDGFFWYAGDRYLQQSNQNAPGGCPSAFRLLTPQKVIGLGKTDTFPILFTDTAIYRIEGTFDEFGDAGFSPKYISKVAGCISNRSIVSTPDGIVWAGIGNFWWTDGYQAKQISHNIPDRYRVYHNPQMVGVYDATRNVVAWTCSTSEANTSAANDIIITLSLDFGITEASTFAVQSAVNNIYPTTLGYTGSSDVPAKFRNRLLIGESRGYMLWQDENVYTDPYIDTTVFPSAFVKKCIRYRWESAALTLGDDSQRKYTVLLTAEIDAATEVSAQFFTKRDVRGAWNSLSEFRQDGAIVWGISEYPWYDPSTDGQAWNDVRLVDGQRYIKHGTLRGARWQVAMTNSNTWIAKSASLGTATTSDATPYVSLTLDDSSQKWPDDCNDYEICFDDDDYAVGYTVFSRVSDTVIWLINPYGDMPQGPAKNWQMRGYRKNERVKLQSVTLWPTDSELTQKPGSAPVGTNG